jgi:hypothetical protein
MDISLGFGDQEYVENVDEEITWKATTSKNDRDGKENTVSYDPLLGIDREICKYTTAVS